MSAGHVGSTRGSGIVSSAADLLWMSGVGGVCEMCMCLARSGVDERIGFWLYQSCGNRGSVGGVVNVYHDHLKFCVVGINGRRYVCCSECNVVSNESNDPTSCLV